MQKKGEPLEKALPKAFYLFLRNFKGFNDEQVLDMPSPRFWLLIEGLQIENEEREKAYKKQGKTKHGGR